MKPNRFTVAEKTFRLFFEVRISGKIRSSVPHTSGSEVSRTGCPPVDASLQGKDSEEKCSKIFNETTTELPRELVEIPTASYVFVWCGVGSSEAWSSVTRGVLGRDGLRHGVPTCIKKAEQLQMQCHGEKSLVARCWKNLDPASTKHTSNHPLSVSAQSIVKSRTQ